MGRGEGENGTKKGGGVYPCRVIVSLAVIERTRDVKENIRHDAFLWLSTKCSIRNITISSRIKVSWHSSGDVPLITVIHVEMSI